MRGTRAAGSRRRQSVWAVASRDTMLRVPCRFKVAATDVAEAVAVPSAAVLLTPARSARTAKTPTKVARLNNFSDPNRLTLPAKSTPYGVSRSGSRAGRHLPRGSGPGDYHSREVAQRCGAERLQLACSGPEMTLGSRSSCPKSQGVPGSMRSPHRVQSTSPAATRGENSLRARR